MVHFDQLFLNKLMTSLQNEGWLDQFPDDIDQMDLDEVCEFRLHLNSQK